MVSTSDGFPAIFKVADEISQGIDDLPQHSSEWCYLLQQIRNAKANGNPGRGEMARLYQAYCALPFGSSVNSDGKVDKIGHKKAFVGITINVSAGRNGFHTKNKVGDLVPYKDGEFLVYSMAPGSDDEIPAEGTMVRVSLPTIYDAEGVVCLGEWEPA